jgi:hypothetical protein
VPTDRVARLLDQIHQPVPADGVFAGVHFESVQDGLKAGDLCLSRGDARLLAPAHDLWINDGGEGRQDDEHQQHFHKGETLLGTPDSLVLWQSLYSHIYSYVT